MILKEAFRFQNKLEDLFKKTIFILDEEENVTVKKKTYLYSKANPAIENHVISDISPCKYRENINQLIDFLDFLIEQREILSYEISEAKKKLSFDMDSEISLNGYRKRLARAMQKMSTIEGHQMIDKNGGVGYCFNNEGNQVAFRCDVEEVTTIDFDRNKVRAVAAKYNKKADKASREIDKILICTEIDYTPPFDVNESLETILTEYILKQQ
ncbi:MAG: hypothetical protein IIY78_03945 [Clostridia bacterium]|nr:hypothetical protein [Clostridia bacterium]